MEDDDAAGDADGCDELPPAACDDPLEVEDEAGCDVPDGLDGCDDALPLVLPVEPEEEAGAFDDEAGAAAPDDAGREINPENGLGPLTLEIDIICSFNDPNIATD